MSKVPHVMPLWELTSFIALEDCITNSAFFVIAEKHRTFVTGKRTWMWIPLLVLLWSLLTVHEKRKRKKSFSEIRVRSPLIKAQHPTWAKRKAKISDSHFHLILITILTIIARSSLPCSLGRIYLPNPIVRLESNLFNRICFGRGNSFAC